MSAWLSQRQLVSCLLVSIAAFSMFRVETSSLTGTLHVARSGHQATLLLDGRVLVTGGSDERGQAIGLAEIFSPVTDTWSPAAANLIPRLGHAASLLDDGRVLVVGGVSFASGCEPVTSAEVYDPSTDRWSVTSKIPKPVDELADVLNTNVRGTHLAFTRQILMVTSLFIVTPVDRPSRRGLSTGISSLTPFRANQYRSFPL
jgi:hypothetical protein